MGRTHLRALSASKTVRVVAAAEPSDVTRAALHHIALYADVADMLGGGGLDGVLIAAPSPLHRTLISRVAQANLPILCEKPCGITPAHARKAAAIASAHNVKLQVAYWRRFVPALQRLRQRISDGEFGDLYCINCYQWDGEPPAAPFQASSGGIFIDMGVHEFDQIRWLTGQEIVHLHATISAGGESAQALATLSGGSSALISLGRRHPLGDTCRVEVFGSRNAEDCRYLWPPDGDAVFLDALRSQAEAFAAWVRGSPSSGATAGDAVAALVAAEQASRD
jgi:myo-inositol 2-dehydrogenase/D-chiro-inositol 1-dehydrogenase